VLEHVVILKDDCFKERHWNQLFDHMKENDKNAITMEKKPDLAKITLNDLLELHLLNYTKLLRSLLAKARQEALIESKINEIKKSIQEINISSSVFD